MNRLVILVAALALAGAAAAAPQPASAPGSYYYWLHPKLGIVKVDRASNAMVVSGKQAR